MWKFIILKCIFVVCATCWLPVSLSAVAAPDSIENSESCQRRLLSRQIPTVEELQTLFYETILKFPTYCPRGFCFNNVGKIFEILKNRYPSLKSSDFVVLIIFPKQLYYRMRISQGPLYYMRMTNGGLAGWNNHVVLSYKEHLFDIEFDKNPIVLSYEDYFNKVLDVTETELASTKNISVDEVERYNSNREPYVLPMAGEIYLNLNKEVQAEPSHRLRWIHSIKSYSAKKYLLSNSTR